MAQALVKEPGIPEIEGIVPSEDILSKNSDAIYHLKKAHSIFRAPSDIDEPSTKLLKKFDEGKSLRRSKSCPHLICDTTENMRTLVEASSSTQINSLKSIETFPRNDQDFKHRTHTKDRLDVHNLSNGLNWICEFNAYKNGVNGACMQPWSLSPLCNLDRPQEGNFNLQPYEVTTRHQVCRNLIEDAYGELHDEDRLYYIQKSTSRLISPWHDISLIHRPDPSELAASSRRGSELDLDIDSFHELESSSNSLQIKYLLEEEHKMKCDEGLLVNMVVEIPRFHYEKQEISIRSTHNPIVQDREKDSNRARRYHGLIPWNYGAIPQTWEDPLHSGDEEVNNATGDGDPLDVVDIARVLRNGQSFKVGDVIPIRILGCLPMIDGGNELDWKVIGINRYDVNFDKIHDLQSLERIYPHTLTGVREWFRWYKFIKPGSKLNDYGYKGLVLCRCGAENVVFETHQQWKNLMTKSHEVATLKLRQESCEMHTHVVRDQFNTNVNLTEDEFPYQVWCPNLLRPGETGWNNRNKRWGAI